MKRVPPSVRMKEEVDAVLRGTTDPDVPADEPVAEFVRATARYMLQVAIEAEATTFLGRGHYRRGERARAGWRNGYEPKRMQTEGGLLELPVPQLRGTDEAFRPRVADQLVSRTPDLEALVRGMYVRGLSTQDVSALYGETFGAARLSQSTVSRITQRLHQEFDTWRRRDSVSCRSCISSSTANITRHAKGRTRKKACYPGMRCWKTVGRCLLHLDVGSLESYDA